MNNFKKIGLTALAGSLVVTSAFAGELTVSGDASMGIANVSGTADDGKGKNFTMGNEITFAGSGELDNGLNVVLSFTLDQADDQSAGTNVATATAPFDAHSVTISSDALGTLKFSGEGGSSAQGAMDTTAAGDIWNNTLGINGNVGPTPAASGDNSLYYTLPAMVDGLAITASLAPRSAAATDTHTSFGVAYTGVEGLTLKYGQGDSGVKTSEVESRTMMASYAIGSFTVSASNTDVDATAANTDLDVTSYQVAYTVSENLSVTFGTETFDKDGSPVDEEVTGFGVSYTSGGMTISGSHINAEHGAHVAANDTDRWALTAAFAF
jgi:outer membrane protein OmpU